MDLDRIRELLRIVADSSVAEVEIEEGDFKLVVRKNTATVMMQAPTWPGFGMNMAPSVYPQAPPVQPYPQQAPSPVPTPSPPSPEAPAPTLNTGEVQPAAAPAEEKKGIEVHAPIVGTFYRAPAPDADAFVEVGSQVEPGDVLCIIEAMKLMNEIECEVAGTVSKILVQDAEAVEYDQPLFIIDPA